MSGDRHSIDWLRRELRDRRCLFCRTKIGRSGDVVWHGNRVVHERCWITANMSRWLARYDESSKSWLNAMWLFGVAVGAVLGAILTMIVLRAI